MLWKKSSENSTKKVFLYSHEYRDQKWGGKSAKQFFQKHTNSASKKCWGKNRKEVRKTVRLYSHEYRYQKMGGKTREIFFPETQE